MQRVKIPWLAPVDEVARELVGWSLATRDEQNFTLVEVEAYGGVGEDPASHAYSGRSRRNEAMFGPPHHLYVYRSYGIHECVNIVSGPEGTAAAVLLRAAVPLDPAPGIDPAAVARGPGRLARALGVTMADCGAGMTDAESPLRLVAGPAHPVTVASGPRIGISRAADRPWRFWIADHPAVSRYRRSRRAPAEPPPAQWTTATEHLA